MGSSCSRSETFEALVDQKDLPSYNQARNEDQALAKGLEKLICSSVGLMNHPYHKRSSVDHSNRIYIIKANDEDSLDCMVECWCKPHLKDRSGNYIDFFWYTDPELRESVLGNVNDIIYFNQCLKGIVVTPTVGYYTGAHIVITTSEDGAFLWLQIQENTTTPQV